MRSCSEPTQSSIVVQFQLDAGAVMAPWSSPFIVGKHFNQAKVLVQLQWVRAQR